MFNLFSRHLCNPVVLLRLLFLVVANGYLSHAQQYIDIASEQGLDMSSNSLHYGSGVNFYDFDQDGWDDLTFGMENDSIRFYRNVNGSFQQMPKWLYGDGAIKHIIWVDYDNDYDLDLAVTRFGGSYKLYRNDGGWQFTDVSEEAGLLQLNEHHYGVSFADYDKDGDLDVYFANYEYNETGNYFHKINHLYNNNGDGTFTDVTNFAGVGDDVRLSFKGVWFDYDMDGWQDLFVINDRVYRNSLYKNNGDGTFTDVSETTGIALPGQDPMTATVTDFDHDGDLDVFMTNTDAPAKRAQLLVNNGDGTFSELSEEYGTDIFGWTWGAVWVDIDNDTDQDLYVCHGDPHPLQSIQKDFFLTSHNGAFFTNTTSLVIDQTINNRSYAVARGDIDNDGFYDLVVHNTEPYYPNLFHNSANANNFIKITLQGTVSNSMAIGSWIKVFVDGVQYTQYTFCGENYLSQNSQHHIFGLDTATTVDSVRIEYNLGHTDTYYNLAANQHYFFKEGETYQVDLGIEKSYHLCEGDTIVLDAGEHAGYLWNNGHQERYLTVSDSGSYFVEVQNEFGIVAVSDTIDVSVFPNPYPEPTIVSPACAGDSTGLIILQNFFGTPASQVIWDHGDEGVEIDSLWGGAFTFQFTDTNGCTASGEVFVPEPLPLSVLIFTFPEFMGNDGSLTLVINGGTPPYQIFLNDIPVANTTDTLSGGIYQLLVADQNDCIFTAEITIDSSTDVDEIDRPATKVFPNPVKAGNTVKIELNRPEDIARVEIINSEGQVVKHFLPQRTEKTFSFSTDDLAPGVYQLKVGYDNATTESLPLLVID